MLNLIPAAPLLAPARRYLLFDQTSSAAGHRKSSRKTRPHPGQGRWPQQVECGDAPGGGVEPGPRIGARADLVEARDRTPVRSVARQRPPEVGLVEGGGTRVDVAANEARVAALDLGRGEDRPAGD